MADEPRVPPPAAPPAKPSPPAAPGGAARAEHKPAAAAPAGPPDPPPPADKPIPPFVAALQAAVPDAVTQVSYWVGDWTVIVPAARLLDVARHLKEAGFDFCSDVTASDWPHRPQRFDVVYSLYSIRDRQRLRVKVRAAEHEPVPSVTGLWPAANWLEREVFDMFGIEFEGHPDMRRILLPEEWQGHPLRKELSITQQDSLWVKENLGIDSAQ